MKKIKKISIFCVLGAILCIFSACQKDNFKLEEGKEPQISLFINDTKETKDIFLEEYLMGVVAAEMNPDWPLEALSAQAILARTFTIENIESGRIKELYGTDASTSVEEFQAYDPSRINEAVKKAVENTKGQVVTYDDEYIKAWFSACDGGKSASAWEGLAYNKTPTDYLNAGVEDGCLAIAPPENNAWEAYFSLEEIQKAVKEVNGSEVKEINNIEIIQKGESGRAEVLSVNGVQVGGPAFRLSLGSEKLRSILIDEIELFEGGVVFRGKGYGHGVGMCQWGANLLASSGKTAEEIIHFYFKDVEIEKLW